MKKYKIKRIESVTLLPNIREIRSLSKEKFLKVSSPKNTNEQQFSFSYQSPETQENSSSYKKAFFVSKSYIYCLKKLFQEGFFKAFDDLYTAVFNSDESELSDIQFEKVIDLLKILETMMDLESINIAEAYIDVGTFLFHIGHCQVATYFVQKASFLTENEIEINPSIIKVYLRAQLYRWLCLEEEQKEECGIPLLEKAICRANSSEEIVAEIICRLRETYQKKAENSQKNGDYIQSSHFYKKCVDLCTSTTSEETRIDFLLKRAESLIFSNENYTAIEILDRFLKSGFKLSKKKQLIIYRLLGEAFHRSGELEEAEVNYKTIYAIVKEEKNEDLNFLNNFVSFNLGKLYWQKTKLEESIKYFQEALEETDNPNVSIFKRNDIITALGLAKGLKGFGDFLKVLSLSETKMEDMVTYKFKKRRE